jgi:hypothetical protein
VRTVRILALLCVLLALMGTAAAFGWRHEHLRAECWRATAEDGVAPEGPCDR